MTLEDWGKLLVGNGPAVVVIGWWIQRSLEKLKHELASKTRKADYWS